jgi:ABC-2 type transport system permease protein
MNALRGELRKLWTVRTTWIITVFGWCLVALVTAMALFTTLVSERFAGTDVEVAAAVEQLGSTAIIVLIVALLAMTTEFRHGTIGRTLQIVPSRTRVLLAKLGAGCVYALAYYATSLVLVGILLGLAAVVYGVSLSMGALTIAALWQAPVALLLNAVLGVAVGALLRSQVAAITAVLLWFFVAENIIVTLLPAVGRWLPFQALNSLFVGEEARQAALDAGMSLLAAPTALTVFLAYVTAASIAAITLLRTRDV